MQLNSQSQLLHFRQPWAWAQGRAHRSEQRDVEADHRRLGWHLHDQHRDVLLVGVGTGRMRAPEFLDDHRLAVVGRANQQQVGHALLVWPRIQGFQPVQRLDRARVADPAVGANALTMGGAIAIELAAQVGDEAGTLVEGGFTSIPDVVSTFKWGWLPVGPLITQRFEAVKRVSAIGSPLLVVHGGEDRLIQPELGRRLFEAATGPKAFVLVEGGSHHNTNSVGQPQYRVALTDLFGLP